MSKLYFCKCTRFHSCTKILTLISLISAPDSRHYHPDSPHSYPYSLHSHPHSPHFHHPPHFILRFHVPAFTYGRERVSVYVIRRWEIYWGVLSTVTKGCTAKEGNRHQQLVLVMLLMVHQTCRESVMPFLHYQRISYLYMCTHDTMLCTEPCLFFDKVGWATFTLTFCIRVSRATTALQQGLFSVNFEKFLRFLPEHPQANTFAPFRHSWDFTTALKTVAVFLLSHCDTFHSPTKTIIPWHFKDIKTLYNQLFEAVLWNSWSEKF